MAGIPRLLAGVAGGGGVVVNLIGNAGGQASVTSTGAPNVALTGATAAQGKLIVFPSINTTQFVNGSVAGQASFTATLTVPPPIGNALVFPTYEILIDWEDPIDLTVLNDTPTGYWRFQEVIPSTAFDTSHNHLNGFYTVAPANTAVQLGRAGFVSGELSALFSGNSRVIVPYNAALDFDVACSLEAWFLVTSLPASGTWWEILAKGSETSYFMRIDTSTEGNKVSGFVNIGGLNDPRASSIAAPSLGVWHHAVATYDGASLKLYLDKVLQSTVARSGTIGMNTQNLFIGAYSDTNNFFQGNLAEIAVYNYALNQIQVNTHYDSGLQLNPGRDVTSRVWMETGLTYSRGRDQIRALAPPMAGSSSMDLDNSSRDYSTENQSSPLYDNLVPGRLEHINATWATVKHHLACSLTDNIVSNPDLDKRTVTLPGLGVLSGLRNRFITTTLYQSITADQALGVICDAVGWPATKRIFDVGATTMAWWWLENADAFDAAAEVFNTEGPGAALFEDGDGNIVFQNRHHRLLATRSTNPQVVLTGGATEPSFREPFDWNPGLKDIINTITITVTTRQLDPLGVTNIWTGPTTPITLNPFEVWSATISGSDPFTNAQLPTYHLTFGSLTPTLSQTSGSTTNVVLTAGAAGAIFDSPAVSAQKLLTVFQKDVNPTVDTSVSRRRYGAPTYTYQIREDIDLNLAQDFVNAIVTSYQIPRPTGQVQLEASFHKLRMDYAVQAEVGDRVTIIEPQTGVASDAIVEKLDGSITDRGEFTLTLGCEKVNPITSTFARWSNGADQNTWGHVRWAF